MYAHTASRIALPSRAPQPSLQEAFDTPALQPICFFTAGSEIYALVEGRSLLPGRVRRSAHLSTVGAVRIYRLLADGRRQISAFHLAGETFGFEADTTHHFFAEAINATGIRVFRFAAGADISRQLLPLALKGLTRLSQLAA